MIPSLGQLLSVRSMLVDEVIGYLDAVAGQAAELPPYYPAYLRSGIAGEIRSAHAFSVGLLAAPAFSAASCEWAQPMPAARRPARGPSALSTALVSIRHACRPHELSNQAS